MATQVREIPLAQLVVSDFNTRTDLIAGQEDSSIEDLATSIREKGLLQPVTVRPRSDGNYEVVIGQRRLLACRKAGHDPVSCLVRDDLEDADAMTISLIENVHRADMNPLDKARTLKKLYERYGTYQRVAEETSWSAQTVSKYVILLDLPESIRVKVSTFEGAAGVGALSKLARTFSGEDASVAYNKIAGFKQSVQVEIIKRSEGDIDRVDDLVVQAVEGAFEIRQCGGKFRCEVIRDILEGKLDEVEFEELVQNVALSVARGIPEEDYRDAARSFWRTLAKG